MKIKFSYHTFLYASLLAICFYLSACSSDEDLDDSTSWAEDMADEDYADEAGGYDLNPSDEGWRKGKLTVEFEILQKARFYEQSKATTTINWEFILNATLSQEVWVAPDLSEGIKPNAKGEALENMLNFEPYFIEDDQLASEKMTGQAIYNMEFKSEEPNANDYISMHNRINSHGELLQFSIHAIKPSIYGDGYQLDVAIDYRLAGKENRKSVHRSGEIIQDNNEGEFETDPLKLAFYPDPTQLIDIRDIGGDDALFQKTEHEVNKQFFDSLKLTASTSTKILTDIRTGLKTKASKDKLSLRYVYSGDKQIPFQGDIEILAAKPQENRMSLTATIEAD